MEQNHIPAMFPDIIATLDSNQKVSDLPQLQIRRVVNERTTIDGIFGMKNIRHRRVVHNYCMTQVSIEKRKIFYVVSYKAKLPEVEEHYFYQYHRERHNFL
jgi:hypothetical protein